MSKIKSDIEIARAADIKPIGDVLSKANIPDDPFAFSGRDINAINQGVFQEKKTIKSANRLLKSIINFHLDGRRLKTRRVLEELKRFGD